MNASLDHIAKDKHREPSRFLIGAAGLLALVSASCCVLPIGLSIIGLGGSWLLMLGLLVTYRIPIVIIVGIVLIWAWYRLWLNWKCASRRQSTLAILIATTLCFAVAATAPLWETEATRTMFALWRLSRS